MILFGVIKDIFRSTFYKQATVDVW